MSKKIVIEFHDDNSIDVTFTELMPKGLFTRGIRALKVKYRQKKRDLMVKRNIENQSNEVKENGRTSEERNNDTERTGNAKTDRRDDNKVNGGIDGTTASLKGSANSTTVAGKSSGTGIGSIGERREYPTTKDFLERQTGGKTINTESK